MNDSIDELLTDGLRHATAALTMSPPSFSDVRRRARIRRGRQLATVALPAAAGLILIGTRSAPSSQPLQPAASDSTAPPMNTATTSPSPASDPSAPLNSTGSTAPRGTSPEATIAGPWPDLSFANISFADFFAMTGKLGMFNRSADTPPVQIDPLAAGGWYAKQDFPDGRLRSLTLKVRPGTPEDLATPTTMSWVDTQTIVSVHGQARNGDYVELSFIDNTGAALPNGDELAQMLLRYANN